MKILGINFGKKKISFPKNSSFWTGFNMVPFTGEKTPYELGQPFEYEPHIQSLSARSWKAFLDTDIVQNAIRKYILWIIGSGLKMQSEPIINVLNGRDINFDSKRFISDVESNFRLFASSKYSTYDNTQNIHELAIESLKTALLSGDVLCIIRFNGVYPTMQSIDGKYVDTPLDDKLLQAIENRGNKIIQGVEINKKGQHVAYYVMQDDGTFKRIVAQKNGIHYAWLMYGLKYKLSDVRGISLLTAVLSTAAKMDRYKDATIGAAEENAKIPYTIEHNKDSDGENPLIGQLAQSLGKQKGIAPETQADCDVIATKVAQTTEKQVYNLPVGATLKRNAGPTDPDFANFFNVNIDIVYATLGIPPEVAMDKFGGSYSSSRAALKSWEYKMKVDRILMVKNQFYKPFFDFWLDVNVLNSTITAPGYLQALNKNDFMVLESYRNCRFIGATVPHIDPLKEITAERKKLGVKFDNIPLTSAEQSCESLNTGDFSQIIEKSKDEYNNSDFFNQE